MAKFSDYNLEECECICDNCGKNLIVNSSDYTEVNDELKSEGWAIKRIGVEWHEFCSLECLDRFIDENYIEKENDGWA